MVALTGFNENQKKAVLHKDDPCVVLAGAGSGKTRVLTYRINNLIEEGIQPHNILAVTFTKKASEEMKERLEELIGDEASFVNVGTFHSICYSILREEWKSMKHPFANSEIAPDWWQKKVVKEIMSPPSNKFPYGINLDWQPRQALSFIGFQKNNLIRPTDPLIISPNVAFMEGKLRNLYKIYEQRKINECKIDFDDMLILCYEMLRDNPKILARYRELFKYILVDEFQDTNLAQAEILKLLAEKHRNLFVVGDDYQSIYGFRASKVELIIDFPNNWEGAKVIPLDINYRSTANIVEWSNRLIKNNTKQADKTCKAHQNYYKDPDVFEAFDEDEEADHIAEEMIILQADGYKPKDMAILYRTNAQSRALEEAMIKNKIPYVVLGATNFYNRKEIKDLLAYLRLSQDTKDDESLERVINKPNRFLGNEFVKKLSNYCFEEDMSLHEGLSRCPIVHDWRYRSAMQLARIIDEIHECKAMKPVDMIKLIRELTQYDSWLTKDDDNGDEGDMDRLDNINSLMMTASRYNTIKDLLDFIDNIATKQADDKGEQDKVKLMSIHRSKGLEFPVVFVAGVNQGLIPHRNSETVEAIEEERRLMYVAMTRAKKLLYMSHTTYYQQGRADMSQFLEEVLEGHQDLTKEPWW